MPEAAHAKLVAVTGYGRQQDRESTRAAGFDHHLVKPVDLAELLGILDAAA
jgi:CheY-like chemotaxis protein